jgi:superfamily II DNA helicase RecQ
VCAAPRELGDYTIAAQMLLSCAVRTGERFGASHLIDVLRGSESERVRRLGHERLSTHGIGRERSKEEWQHIARELVQGGYARREPEFGGLELTDRGRTALAQRAAVHLPRWTGPTGRPRSTRRPSELIAAARRGGDPGTAGDASAGAVPSASPSARSALASTTQRSLELFRAGKTVADIAATRNLAPTTIEGHLAEAIENGELDNVEALVPAARQRRIEAAIDEVGAERLAPIRERLGDDFGYGEIRFARAAYLRRQLVESGDG